MHDRFKKLLNLLLTLDAVIVAVVSLFILFGLFYYTEYIVREGYKFEIAKFPKISDDEKEIRQEIEKFNIKDINLKLLFTGDIFLGRNVREKSLNSNLVGDEKYKYPFQKLNSLNREKYDAWIGNLECPVTDGKVDYRDEHVYLKFNCDKRFLPELRKYFDILSLSNNHTDNMDGQKGLDETRVNLQINNFQYFGHFDNAIKKDICEVVEINTKNNIKTPIAICGYHGVFKLPTDEEIKVISEYSKHFLTIVMPHQGVEYEMRSGTYQKSIYKKFIDAGADMVVGAHPHVMQEVEEYKGKLIFYSLGNFIFDQTGQVTRRHFALDTQINFKNIDTDVYSKFKCESYKDNCLEIAKQMNLPKPEFEIKYKPIATESNLDFITQKRVLDEKGLETFYKQISWDKIDDKFKFNNL